MRVNNLSVERMTVLVVIGLKVELQVDGDTIGLNEFVAKILGGTLVGAVTSLRGIPENWTKIEVKLTR